MKFTLKDYQDEAVREVLKSLEMARDDWQGKGKRKSAFSLTAATGAATTEFYKQALRAWDFAVETGMRAGEICGLTEIKGNVAVLEDTKNGTRREVPLSPKAVELWKEGGFNLTPKVLDVNWRRLCKMAQVEGLHFHDSRHLAATRLAQKLNLLELCKMFGWKDPRHAMIYFNQTAAEIAKKL